MAIITIFSGSYCYAEEIAQRVSQQLGYDFLSNDTLLSETSKRFSTSVDKLKRAIYGTPSFLNRITHEKEHSIAYLRAALADLLQKDNIVYHGMASLLLPKKVTNALKVYIIANREFRVENAIKKDGISEKAASKLNRKSDNECVRWTHYLFGKAPWDESLYDIIIPMNETSIDSAVSIICENVKKDVLQTTPESQRAMEDFILAAKIGITLIENSHTVDVECSNGNVTLIINKYVIRFEHYKNELSEIIETIPGVVKIDARFSQNVSLPTMTRNIDFEVPSKILLVDDEVEFVHTLSERLKTRKMETSVVYDGEEALSVVEEEEPEVMILDLKMPGIDGIEVLRKVKKTKPNVEVIILTGHGSTKEKEMAEELGAFAYLEKPVDIETLTKTMQEAYKKVNKK